MKKKIDLAIKLLQWAKDHNLFSEVTIATLTNGTVKVSFNCQAKSYKTVHEFSRLFKIGFKKSKSASEGCLNYDGETEDMIVSLYAIGELPLSCKVKYETINVPAKEAYTKKIATVVCN